MLNYRNSYIFLCVPKHIRKPRHPVTKALQAVGFSPITFAQEHLGIKYNIFAYRVRNGCLKLEDIQKILAATGKDFETLFPNPYKSKPQPIPLTIGPSRTNSIKPPATTTRKPKIAAPSNVTPLADASPNPRAEEQKKEQDVNPAPASSSEFVPFDIFEDGLPS